MIGSINKYVTLGIVALLLLGGGYYLYTQTPDEKHNVDLLSEEGGLETSSEEVEYIPGAIGWYAEPVEEGEYPGVVMIHEWWGLNEHIKNMAEELAAEGYRVLAVDLFGSVATTPEEARTQTSTLNQEEALANMYAAKHYLKDRGAERIASLGWCFGGRQSVEFSIAGEVLDATVVYYGSGIPTTTDELSPIEWPVLGIFGEEDQSIPVEVVRAFEDSLDTLSVENEIYLYPNVEHAFANPSGMSYAPEETQDAWAKTLTFLEKHLK